jgi:hypothetical protein
MWIERKSVRDDGENAAIHCRYIAQDSKAATAATTSGHGSGHAPLSAS